MKAPQRGMKRYELEAMVVFRRLFREIVRDETGKAFDRLVKSREQTGDNADSPTRWLYCIQAESGEGPVKLGIANEPLKRLADLQRTSPIKLAVVAVRVGAVSSEKELHQRFAEWRLHGEWFEPSAEILEEIATWQQVAVTTEQVPA